MLTAACGNAATPSRAALETKTVSAGSVQLTIQPIRIDASGAAFNLQVDTHSGSLDLDLPGASKLEVDGRGWQLAGWSGDGPGGHHRRGELRFTARGTSGRNATLTISGLSSPVVVSWQLGSA